MVGPHPPSYKDPAPTVTRSGNTLQLEVDTRSNQTLGPTLVAPVEDGQLPLHLGGLPGEHGLSLGVGVTPLSSTLL